MSDGSPTAEQPSPDLLDDFAEPLFQARNNEDDYLTIQVAHWEGPLDLLLALARTQRVDLREISILALVEQYLDFIANSKALKLELAADYLVMAAWLAYLKSGLLLPRDPQEQPSPETLALRLQLRLQRLAAMREASARLFGRDLLGRDVFSHGAPAGLRTIRKTSWECSYFDLIQAYGQVHARTAPVVHSIARAPVFTLEAALERIGRLVGARLEWATLESFLPDASGAVLPRSALASSFVAALELARQGRVELRQAAAFAPLYLRAASAAGTAEAGGHG